MNILFFLTRIYSKSYQKKYKLSHTHQSKILICYKYIEQLNLVIDQKNKRKNYGKDEFN